MHWFGGSIAEAVTLSKQKNAIFVVFVEGENDLSVEMAATIEDEEVVSRLSNETNFLAVKLKSGTTNYTHFAQIYQFVPVPSLFFIGRNGTPLEVVCAGVHVSNLATRIDRILQEHHMEKPGISQPSTSSSSQALRQATTGLIQAEGQASAPVDVPSTKAEVVPAEAPSPPKFPKPAPPSDTHETTRHEEIEKPGEPDYEVVCQGDVCVRRPRNDQASSSQSPTPTTETPTAPSSKPVEPTTSERSVEEKMDRAKELIEAKRREKAEKEKELEKQKELERRTTGQGVAELKKWQADQEMKQLQEERKREKMENNMARQRVLDQIAQDRAERRARDTPAAAPTAVAHTPPPTSGDADGAGAAGAGAARVQFKLPDGRAHTAHFHAHDTLATLHEYVTNNLQLSSSNFALWTAFPRRELTERSATLLSLELAPSAALLLLPRTVSPTQGPTQYFSLYVFITSLLTTYLYNPSLTVVSWLRARLFPPPAVAPRRAPSPPAGPQGGPTVGGARRRTNIHRLPGDDNDDDNNTWNGNSTQQM